MVLISNSFLILNPLIFRHAVDVFDPNSISSENFISRGLNLIVGNDQQSLRVWGLLLVFVALISAIFKYGMRLTFISISREAEKEVRSELFERIQNQSMAFFDRHGIGELLSRLTNDITSYRDVLGPGIMYPLFFITLMVPGLFALFSISKPLATISLFPLLIIPLINASIRKQIYRLSRNVQKTLADMSNMAQEHFSAIRIVKGYVIENALFQKFSVLCRHLANLNVRLAVLQGLLYPLFTLLTKVITVLLVLFAGVIIVRAWSDLTPADFVSFMWIQSYIFFPVLMLGWLLPIYERGRAAYDRLVEIYEEPIEVQDAGDSQLHIPDLADIQITNLTFTYPTASMPSLENINLTVQGGSFVGITGPIGSGKSTLFRLLNREYEIPRGMITIGDHDIHDFSLDAFRKQMVTVEQAPFLFSKTIAENVRFGRQEASQEELELVAEYADLHETVLDFPDRYHTMIGERGVTLSGGQKQRVAMARAFLVNRTILLLDDIFSAVDTATEKRIFEAMRENFRGKTVLLITHRMTILEQMDRVVYLMNGHVVEDGTPKELMAKGGHYAALAELQRLD